MSRAVRSAPVRVLVFALVLAGLALIATAPSAFAANIIVNISADEDTANGDCSLREAIVAANTDAAYNGCTAGSGTDSIIFNIPGAALSVRTIEPTNALGNLPNIITPLTIDGWSQGVFDGTAGYNAAPLIELSGVNGPTGVTNAGLAVLGTSANGVLIRGLIVNRFTGTNTSGIRVDGGARNVTLHGNYVGLNAAGTAGASNNQFGISVTGVATTNVTIGGTSPEHRNVVSGTTTGTAYGINIELTGNNIAVQGNYVGTNAAGTAAVPNFVGVAALSSANNIVVGGTAAGAGNLVSGNTFVQIGIGRNVQVQGNWIGTNAAGTGVIPSAGIGIDTAGGMLTTATIGGTTAAARNVIVGMASAGYEDTNANHSISILGNYFGVMPDGVTPAGNGIGISIRNGTGFTIGGTAPGAGNLITNNTTDGIRVSDIVGRALIRGNRIFNNGTTASDLGIEVGANGVTANDTGDADTGANTLLNFPVLTSAGLHAGATRVTGTLNSTASTSFEIDLYANTSCDTSGSGEGETYLGSTSVTTDINGNGAFAVLNLPATTLGQFITATTSNTTTGATSEFSVCRTVVAPSIGVTPTSGLTTTEAGGSATFDVQLAVAPSSVVIIGVSSSDLTEGGVSPATLTFQPDATGVVAQTVTLTGVDDLIQDGNVVYTAILAAATSADNAYSGVNPTDVSATNQDNDGTPTLSIANVQQAEGASGSAVMTFTVSLNPGSLQTVTVQYATSDVIATSGVSCGVGVDYVPASGTLTFSPTEMSKPVQVTICGDPLTEPDETFTVTLSNPTNAPIGQATATGTIQTDDAIASLSVADASVVEGNSGTTPLVFTVELSQPSGQTVTVQYATSAGAAVSGASCAAGVDFQQTSGTLTFLITETSKQISVPVCGDTTDEANEPLTVTLSNPTNALVGQATATGTIQNDDGAPTLSIASNSVSEPDTGTMPMAFTVTLSPASGQTVTVQYATSAGTATSGASCGSGVDFQQTSGTLTFAPGETSKQIPVTVCGDTTDEANETLTVTLSNPTNAPISGATATGTIQDDDVTQTVSVGTAQLTLNPDGTGTATIPVNVAASNLTSAAVAASAAGRPSATAAQAVTVSYTTQDGTAKANVDYLPISGTLAFAPGDSQKTVAVTVLPVGLASPGGIEFRLVLTSTTNGVIAPGQGQATVLLPAETRAVKPSTDDTDKPRQLTEEQRQQQQQTNRSNRDDTHTEGNVLEVGTDADGAYLILANRDGPVTVRLHGDAAKSTVRVGDYVQVEGNKESEALFIADEMSVNR